MMKLKKGLDIPITGKPKPNIEPGREVKHVALLGPDYVGMKPTMEVKPGDKVKKGQTVFTDKKHEGVVFTAPAAGEVIAVHRGDKRAFLSVVIKVDANEEEIDFGALNAESAEEGQLRDLLVKSGMWTALRTRPYSHTPEVSAKTEAIFVSTYDTSPLAADPALIIAKHTEEFSAGIAALTKLSSGKVYLNTGKNQIIPGIDHSGVHHETWDGPHPAGLVGTHIHYQYPVSDSKAVWHLGYQDVIAIGHICKTGKLWTDRYVSLAGPAASKPRIIKTRQGASLSELATGEIRPEVESRSESRIVSGSPIYGHQAIGAVAFLGRFSNQVTILEEGKNRDFLGWLGPGFKQFSVKGVFASKLINDPDIPMTTTTNGSDRAMVPIGMYEEVMPLDILPTFLLRSIVVLDTERAQELGCLELDEEDLALCTFVDPGKVDYGIALRENLDKIYKEG